VRQNERIGTGFETGQLHRDIHLLPQQQQQQHTLSPGVLPAQDFSIPFDMLGFIGEITSDFQQKHLDLTKRSAIGPAMASIDGGIFQDERQMAWRPDEMVDMGALPETEMGSPQQILSGGGIWEEQLLEYFRESEPPPTIFGPVDLEWGYVRDIMLAQSDDCQALLLAIYCYSDMHKSWIDETQWKFGPGYHAQASEKIQACLLGEMGESLLKRVLASVLLLMLAEVRSWDISSMTSVC
jgi:hypothetical protein